MDDDWVFCDSCDFNGFAHQCSVNGDCNNEGMLESYLECPTPECKGEIEEDL